MGREHRWGASRLEGNMAVKQHLDVGCSARDALIDTSAKSLGLGPGRNATSVLSLAPEPVLFRQAVTS